ncbi:MAG: signal peptidase I [Candidatus Portnoybacteria bacterium RIFCSPLOWO2_12_FULL_39_9]|uniref:Signal peptidase I n=1 Tax=Candidatus Portnoybacteria bacterium RIFCSPHIGHO2_12_FULL_38_9 TaxID=1801997 RepID=A0A1G2FJ16_9BACT|nr:MAG: signal peptidase I [Candidatus Portnoybacteria bacterium RIFCSPHIGHO2_02_FULL_39_12]OGZ37521.1 MAG: signal peptidase I [Candidatus Portnoybacteria bacterium RIFCSPHIGHO2_12_FULL_38_9]OGZ39359.1 MAG: signal peptidase I [Candidatus Portnoybacteria bacterium RIFCSPLOWO2_01_FULL_38_39]OGZ39861.1 MAG: signal peptidase I [Candidatus Portnoybacteria bacterium RIFCSPLOWO2_12_FULL_39_9]
MKKFFIFIWEIVKIVVISLAIIIPIRYYLVQPFFVRGASMEPNFDNGEYLVVDELSYRLREPERGEVIVFKFPKDPSQYYIKRIIGLPKETVEVKNNQVIIYSQEFPEGLVLDESAYLINGQYIWGDVKMVLGENEYFVLGDNRGASSDSRQWGLLSSKNIIGRVWVRAWPFDKAEVF